jgi:hypothetical protein
VGNAQGPAAGKNQTGFRLCRRNDGQKQQSEKEKEAMCHKGKKLMYHRESRIYHEIFGFA